MARINEAYLERLLRDVDLPALVNEVTPVKKVGKEFVAKCCFHDEKTPSLTINPQKNVYHCHGCGASGNAAVFVMETKKVPFPEAIKTIAQAQPHLGQVEYVQEVAEPAPGPPKALGLKALRTASEYFCQAAGLPQAGAYLQKRGLTERDAANFAIGYAPAAWDSMLKLFKGSISFGVLEEVGLLARKSEAGRYYDFFHDRLMFPILDRRGQVVAFTARRCQDAGEKLGPKYKNSPDSPIFHKSEHLFGLFQALRARESQHDQADVVEGPMDVVAAHRHGFTQTAGALGTSLTEQHIKTLFSHYHRVNLVFDGDKAGYQAACRAVETALPLLDNKHEITITFLPQGEDVDSLLAKSDGPARYNLARQSARPLSVFLTDHLLAKHGIRKCLSVHAERRAKFLTEAQSCLDRVACQDLRMLMMADLQQRLGVIGNQDCREPLQLDKIQPTYFRHIPDTAQSLVRNANPSTITLCGLALARPQWNCLLTPHLQGLDSVDQELLSFSQKVLNLAEEQQRDPLGVLDNSYRYLAAWLAAPHIGLGEPEALARLSQCQMTLYAQQFANQEQTMRPGLDSGACPR